MFGIFTTPPARVAVRYCTHDWLTADLLQQSFRLGTLRPLRATAQDQAQEVARLAPLVVARERLGEMELQARVVGRQLGRRAERRERVLRTVSHQQGNAQRIEKS